MARIMQRCFVVLAFTGVLLSTAKETTVSEISYSTTQSHETPTSAPESSFHTADTSSFNSSSDEIESKKNASFKEVVEAGSSSHSEITATDVAQPSSKVSIHAVSESKAGEFTTVSSMSENTTDNAHDDIEEKATHNPSHPGLFKSELTDDSVTEAFLTQHHSSEKPETSSSKAESGEKKNLGEVSETETFIPKTERKLFTTEAAVKQPDNVTFPENVSIDSGQSTVPSKEELVSSFIDKNKTPENMTSIAPNKVQNEESENNDTKSATHKRSLNATNAIVSSTTIISSNETSSESSAATSSNHDSTTAELKERGDENHYSTILPSDHDSVSLYSANKPSIENEESVGTMHDILDAKMSTAIDSINSDNPHVDINAGHIMKSGSMVSELPSSAYVQDASLLPVSSDALSTLNKESIHPLDSFDSTAQIANARHVSTMSSSPLKSPELEVEYDESVSNLNSPSSLVTFDPDGMTHKFSQDPDSITFPPKVFIGKPTDGAFSNLEREELESNKPEPSSDDSSTAFDTAEAGSNFHKMTGFYSSEREREVPSANHELIPHDEPDRELPTSVHAFENTKRPEEISSAIESKNTEKSPTDSPKNDESEEMLNDSPHFMQNQNNPTVIPTADFTNKNLNKDLENNISNDITHSTDLNTHLRELHQELDFPIEYQTQQSEIRPVTAISPIKTSETVTDLPISHDIQSQLPSKNATKSSHLVSIQSDMPSSIILPNPAPSTANKSLDKSTVAISPEMLPKDYIPPELLPKDYVPPEMLPKDYVTPESNPKDNIPQEMLPKDFVPSELLPRDYVPTEMPSKEAPKPEMLPKGNLSPDLLPKDFVPTDMLPKDYTPDQSELDNNTDTNINSTIAGVAVKTSVSVSLPLSKSPNNTTGTLENSTKELSNISSKNSGTIPTSIPVNKDSSKVTTEVPSPSTSESGGFRIRKPKIKIGSSDDAPTTSRTRKPFLPSQLKPSTTAGPPVSIFNQHRTRSPSITSSTTRRPFQQFSTIRVHYASRIPGMVPGGEMVFSIESITSTVPTTTETEEPFSEEPFTGQTIGPLVPTDDNVTLLKVAGMIVVDQGLRWNEQLNNRLSPQYKEREKYVQSQLYRLFRTSPIAPQLWKIQIDGFSGKRNSKSVVIDFFLYLIKSQNEIKPDQLVRVFHDKLINNTFSRFTVDTNKTTFEFLNEELMRTTTPIPEELHDPVIPQWAIAVIVVGAASFIFIVLFAAVAILGRHHVRRRYSNKLNDEDSDRPSDWESKMAAAYENLAADTIYDADDFHSDSYKKSYLVD